MGLLSHLMTFFRALRRHDEKPADVEALDARLDEVERQIEQRRQARYERLDAQAQLPAPKGR